jgi:hypothetical protein
VLIIEILSPSTAFKDRQVKFDIYEEQSVKYYLVIDPTLKTYSIYALIGGQYVLQKNIPSFVIHDKCAIQLDIDKALAELGDLSRLKDHPARLCLYGTAKENCNPLFATLPINSIFAVQFLGHGVPYT